MRELDQYAPPKKVSSLSIESYHVRAVWGMRLFPPVLQRVAAMTQLFISLLSRLLLGPHCEPNPLFGVRHDRTTDASTNRYLLPEAVNSILLATAAQVSLPNPILILEE